MSKIVVICYYDIFSGWTVIAVKVVMTEWNLLVLF